MGYILGYIGNNGSFSSLPIKPFPSIYLETAWTSQAKDWAECLVQFGDTAYDAQEAAGFRVFGAGGLQCPVWLRICRFFQVRNARGSP